MQHTLAQPFTLSGPTLHGGAQCQLTLAPAPVGTGCRFSRLDLPAHEPLQALVDWVGPAQLSTQLIQGHVGVRTPEHLLAALMGMGIDNCFVTLDQPEVPILDGSARPYVEAIQQAGRVSQDHPQTRLIIQEPLTVWDGDRFVAAFPGPGLRLSYGIDFPGTVIGQQWISLDLTPESFALGLAPARTFTTLAQVDYLRSRGLIQGGSLDCALVADRDHWVGQLPYWSDEPCRHKALDLLGDLALVGAVLQGHVVAYKAGHDLHGKLAQRLRQQCLTSQP